MRPIALAILISGCALHAQSETLSPTPLPRVTEMAIPKYPPLARIARITGQAEFLIKTDGARVSKILHSRGPRQLVDGLAKQLATWKFEPHEPTEFIITFEMKLASDSVCPPGKPDEIKLLLPTRIELFSTNVKECDPVIVKAP